MTREALIYITIRRSFKHRLTIIYSKNATKSELHPEKHTKLRKKENLTHEWLDLFLKFKSATLYGLRLDPPQRPVKIVPKMTYKVSSGTLSLYSLLITDFL